jgi:S1-C subfamily serine protease
MAAIIDAARRSLVHVHNGQRGSAAGTMWHSDGLVLTNAHAVNGRRLAVSLANGQRLPARLLAQDRANDIAALSVDARGMPAIAIGDSRQLRPGEWVLAVGHPWGVSGAATAGVIAGLGHGLPEMPRGDREWIAVSLHLRPGHSGGPLLDAHGKLVGINTIMAGPDLGLAVPVHVVKEFLRRASGV